MQPEEDPRNIRINTEVLGTNSTENPTHGNPTPIRAQKTNGPRQVQENPHLSRGLNHRAIQKQQP
ncbi:hypothetical protein C922_05649 [Plasmodium inui San Antonio 1]|uniref:Uncharacterized protein n=1 Tax=Plasmodium inui San Antonio 1 TaxID=1237626 RepID=W6ZXH7_9APIC|nr:hypothetical protein C922_05649 [Plasmodium inui San Antonio 1]EUD63970.1 hypothetical protein C922_05649 [Plasmodium inui San Antonio 1]